MCLDNVFRGKAKKKKLVKLKDTVTVWKVLRKFGPGHNGDWRTGDRQFPVHAGEVKFKQNIISAIGLSISYRGGGHFFLVKQDAINYCQQGEKVVRCIIKKTHINTIGKQSSREIVVVKKATFPKHIGDKQI